MGWLGRSDGSLDSRDIADNLLGGWGDRVVPGLGGGGDGVGGDGVGLKDPDRRSGGVSDLQRKNMEMLEES